MEPYYYEEVLEKIQQTLESGATELNLTGGSEVLYDRERKLDHLPAEIGQLTHLQTLNLQCNDLETLPPEIGQLTNLQHLDLTDNRLTTLPPEIGRLTNLRRLTLVINQLTTLPSEIGQLTSLEFLMLWRNQLETLPSEIGSLSHLFLMGLQENRLTTLPPEIGQLTNLQEMDVKNNQLVMLPVEIGQLSRLESLDLGSNRLTALPDEVGYLANLKKLGLADNSLETLPSDLSRLVKLDSLFLEGNPLRAWPLQGPARLRRLDLRRCHQLTYLPDWLKQVHQLNVNGCEQLHEIPKGLRIKEWIDLANTAIHKLPKRTGIHWTGVQIDERIAFKPEKIAVKHVFAERNLERRRIMMERMGYERFIRETNPEIIDQDLDAGGQRRLLRIALPDGYIVLHKNHREKQRDEPFVGLEVIDPSTGRQYILRVPSDMETCHQAAAWVAGFNNPDDYHPIEET